VDRFVVTNEVITTGVMIILAMTDEEGPVKIGSETRTSSDIRLPTFQKDGQHWPLLERSSWAPWISRWLSKARIIWVNSCSCMSKLTLDPILPLYKCSLWLLQL
jgi:hypothetical protein